MLYYNHSKERGNKTMRIHQEKKIVERIVVTSEEYEMIKTVIKMLEDVILEADDVQLVSDAQEARDCFNYVIDEWLDIED